MNEQARDGKIEPMRITFERESPGAKPIRDDAADTASQVLLAEYESLGRDRRVLIQGVLGVFGLLAAAVSLLLANTGLQETLPSGLVAPLAAAALWFVATLRRSTADLSTYRGVIEERINQLLPAQDPPLLQAETKTGMRRGFGQVFPVAFFLFVVVGAALLTVLSLGALDLSESFNALNLNVQLLGRVLLVLFVLVTLLNATWIWVTQGAELKKRGTRYRAAHGLDAEVRARRGASTRSKT